MKKVLASLFDRLVFDNSVIGDAHDAHTVGCRYKAGMGAKEIASEMRKELRARFPECKWSVRKDSGTWHTSIRIELEETPFCAEINEALVAYANKLHDAYNYNNSDSMSDYFDVNFYGGATGHYAKVREATEEEKAVEAAYMAARAEADRLEEEAFLARVAEDVKRREEEAKRYAEERARVAADVDAVEKAAHACTLADDDRFHVFNMHSYRKICSLDEIDNESYDVARDVIVTKTVTMNDEAYGLFGRHLMEDWSFLAGEGGSGTDDPRISRMEDLWAMDEEERKTVRFYDYGVAILDEAGGIRLVVDPQGYNYARYVMPWKEAV